MRAHVCVCVRVFVRLCGWPYGRMCVYALALVRLGVYALVCLSACAYVRMCAFVL